MTKTLFSRWLRNPVLNMAAKTIVWGGFAGVLGCCFAIAYLVTFWRVAA